MPNRVLNSLYPRNPIAPAQAYKPSRAQQQDAREWAKLTGINYTAALHQMMSPRAQGFLGPRIRVRDLISALNNDKLIGLGLSDLTGAEPGCNEYGKPRGKLENPWEFNGKNDYVQLALIVDFLRMFTVVEKREEAEVHSGHLRAAAANLIMGQECRSTSRGKILWAAAALGLPLWAATGDDPLNVLIGVSVHEYNYIAHMVNSGNAAPRVDHSQPSVNDARPAAYDYLMHAQTRALRGEMITDRWQPKLTAPTKDLRPFHDWLLTQTVGESVISTFARRYEHDVFTGIYGAAAQARDLLDAFRELASYRVVVEAIRQFYMDHPDAEPIRTHLLHTRIEQDGGTELDIYSCPCGHSEILETVYTSSASDRAPLVINCDTCSKDWEITVLRKDSVWALVPSGAQL
ncbi:hypothetical protein [Corynebacterium crudilactis]|uniref:Uncharacterized protein n=1 Tax=Corynebacterium crudilactis TaxID=1652495 RepID=A0A172QS32_9CORY|nr:hypothetical protein [Corynebacterium crudilactis]ANE03481.1 hypothetical protein ccrud_04130 [Corynebacterium crudilactis]